jgi:hypothetical protein
MAKKPTENIAAYNEYIKGRYEMWKWTPESVAKAKQHLAAALALDPNFAPACDGLANLYGYLGLWGFQPPDEMEPLRRFYGVRAFELDPTLAEPRRRTAFNPPEDCSRGSRFQSGNLSTTTPGFAEERHPIGGCNHPE